MKIEKVNLQDKFDLFQDQWNPKIIGELNGQFVKLARIEGEFVMHNHEEEDELFMVVEGSLKMELEDDLIEVNSGEIIIIPRGVMHKPIADKECKILLFEPKSTINTGKEEGERTVKKLNWI